MKFGIVYLCINGPLPEPSEGTAHEHPWRIES